MHGPIYVEQLVRSPLLPRTNTHHTHTPDTPSIRARPIEKCKTHTVRARVRVVSRRLCALAGTHMPFDSTKS